MYKIEKTAEAEADLIDIWVYTLQEWGIEQADQYTDELEDAFRLLASNPLMCRERREFVPSVRIHHIGRHFIIYTIESDSILIIRVLHDRADLERHI